MTTKALCTLAVIFAAPLLAAAADIQVNLNTAVSVDVPNARSDRTPMAFKTGDSKDAWVVRVSDQALVHAPLTAWARCLSAAGLVPAMFMHLMH